MSKKRETRPCVICNNTHVILPEIICHNCKSTDGENFPVDCKVGKNAEIILCAAIWYRDEIKREHQPRNIESGIVVCGWRHANCFITLNEIDNNFDKKKHTQGFLTSEGRFVNRYEAFALAKKAGQIITMIKNDDENILTSEDLY